MQTPDQADDCLFNEEEDNFIISNQRYLEEQQRLVKVSDNRAIQQQPLPQQLQQQQQLSWEVSLIEEVRRYDCIWNTRSRAFKERGFFNP